MQHQFYLQLKTPSFIPSNSDPFRCWVHQNGFFFDCDIIFHLKGQQNKWMRIFRHLNILNHVHFHSFIYSYTIRIQLLVRMWILSTAISKTLLINHTDGLHNRPQKDIDLSTELSNFRFSFLRGFYAHTCLKSHSDNAKCKIKLPVILVLWDGISVKWLARNDCSNLMAHCEKKFHRIANNA